jgi:hypothetical protein
VGGGGGFNQQEGEKGKGHQWEQLCKWSVRLRLGDVLRTIHPVEKFITYRANGAKRSDGRGNKKIKTWADHCFASNYYKFALLGCV